MKRLNKEFKIDVCKSIALKYGTVNREDPRVVYINGRCWITPTSEMEYGSVLSSIEANMRKDIKRHFIDKVNFDDRFIFDFSVNTDNLSPSVKKFLTFDLYVRQNNGRKKPLKELKGIVEGKMSVIANNLSMDLKENDFSVSQKKR